MFKPGEIEGIPLGIERQFSDLETRIMEDIIRRLKENGGDITRAADWQIHRLHELGVSQKEIKEYIRESLELSDRQIDEIYAKTIRAGYYRDGSIYKLKGKDQIPYKENTGLQQLIGAVTLQTNGELKNITQTMGFAVRENGKLRFTQLSDYYQKTLDGAMLDITSGAFDYNTVLKRTVRELTNSGLRTVDYASGKSLRVESAARMAVMTGVSQVTAKINEQNAKELDTDYFEVTCHGGARPTHQEWQGKVYSKKELETVCDALCRIPKRAPVTVLPPPIPATHTQAMPLHAVLSACTETLPVSQCTGRICAEFSVSCPPAVPIVICGERISSEAIRCMQYYHITACRVVKA